MEVNEYTLRKDPQDAIMALDYNPQEKHKEEHAMI